MPTAVSPTKNAITRTPAGYDEYLALPDAAHIVEWTNEEIITHPRRYRRQADFYRLGENGRFGEAPIGDDGVYHAAALPGLWLRLAWLWQAPLPNPQVSLAEVLMAADAAPAKIRAAYKALYDAFAESEAQDTA